MSKSGLGVALVATVILVGSAVGQAQTGPDAGRLLGRVRTLTAPEFAGRGSGTAALRAATDTVAGWLAAAGLEPGFGASWFQKFPLRGEGWAGNDLTGQFDRNVAGILRGAGSLASHYVVIGAHLDHLGRVVPTGDDAPPPGPEGYYPGANDNASGVTVVNEMIRLAMARAGAETDRRSIMFVFFGGEEVGLQGSGFFVSHSPVDLSLIDAMINFDTVGQIVDDRIYVSGLGTTPAFPGLVAAANTDHLKLSLGEGGWSGSDHMNFNSREIPVLFIFGGPYPQYNRPADTWDTLTPAGLVQVAAYGARLLDLVSTYPETLPWVMVAQKNLREGDTAGENRDTWFGSMPDFTEEVHGYKLGGVFDGSPAARAGLQKGDVLVSLAGQEVTDLATFTHALRSHAPGDLVEAEVLREGNRLKFTVALGNRAERK